MDPKRWSLQLGLVVALVGVGFTACLESAKVLSKRPLEVGGEACPAFEPGPALSVCSSTYLGSAEADSLAAVAFGIDGALVVGGIFPSGGPDGAPARTLLAGGPGVVLRLTGDGRQVISSTEIGQEVTDLDVAPSGRIVVAGDFGVALLDPIATTLVWSHAVGTVSRVTAGSTEWVAALDATGRVHVWDGNGTQRSQFSVADPIVNDLELGPLGQVYVVGGHPDPSGECQGSVPFLRSYDALGAILWRAYDFSVSNGNCAASQGVRVVLGQDGKLYYGGEQRGGNSAHLRDPSDVKKQATLAGYDPYTLGFGMAILDYSFVGRFDPASGLLETGHVVLPRDGQIGGSLRMGGLDADANGNVYVVGQSGCCIAGRDGLSIAGTALGLFQFPEMSALVVAPDFSSRRLWTTWTESSGSEMGATGVAVAGDRVAIVANQASEAGQAIVANALNPHPLGQSDGFVAVFGAVP